MRDGTKTRLKLERCALELFVEKGISATTIKDIAHKAAVAEGTLYRHYPSKEELAHHLYTEYYKVVSSQMKQVAAQQGNIDNKLRNMTKFFCKNYDEDPILFNYLLLAQHHQLKIIHDKDVNVHELLVGVFKETLHSDPQFCASITMGIVLQAAISRIYGRIPRSMTADADRLTDAILGALKL